MSKTKFKIGDKVRVLGTRFGGWEIETIGFIVGSCKHYNEQCWMIAKRMSGSSYSWLYNWEGELELVDKRKEIASKEKCIVYGTNDCPKEYAGHKVPKTTPLSQRALDEAFALNDSRPIGKKIGNTKTGIIKSKRTFGCELESIAKNPLVYRTARYLLPKEFGYGGDGSIRTTGDQRGIEFKTAPLQGQIGEDTLRKCCSLLLDSGYKVNTSCGTHCHIGIPEAMGDSTELVQERLKNLVLFLTVFEPAVLTLLPKDRRDNSYCCRISDRYAVFKDIKTLQENNFKKEKQFDHFWYSTKDETRLKSVKTSHAVRGRDGFNFNSIHHRGTLEVRLHEGTLDADRIIHWVALHSAIVDLVMDGKVSQEDIVAYKKINGVKELLDKLIELLGNNLDPLTVKYTLARFKKYKKLNPADGYITRVFVENPEVAIRRENTDDYEELDYIDGDDADEDEGDW